MGGHNTFLRRILLFFFIHDGAVRALNADRVLVEAIGILVSRSASPRRLIPALAKKLGVWRI
jgi:hypothetical protein